MPKEVSSEVGQEIVIPTVSGDPTLSQQSDDDLISMQEGMFSKKEDPQGQEDPKSEKKENPADKIFERTQQAKKEEPEKSEEGERFEGEMQSVDFSQFLESSQDDPESGEGDKGEPEPEIDISKEDNLKNLRNVAGNFKKERDEARAKAANLEQQLENRPESTALQSQVTELQNRVKELEHYEVVFALHNNPEFKERYIDASTQIVNEIQQIANDYGLDEGAAEQIVSISNRKDLDEALDEAFSSASARSDIKALKQKYDGIQRDRSNAEAKPREILETFQSEQAQKESELNQRRDTHLKDVSNKGWSAALGAVAQTEGDKIYELIPQPGKKDHNEKVVKPTLKAAQDLYDMGLDYIEKVSRNKMTVTSSFTQWFAQICQQAAATQMVNHSRYGLYNQYQDLKKEYSAQTSFDRPPLNSGGRSKAKGEKATGKNAAAEIFADVMKE